MLRSELLRRVVSVRSTLLENIHLAERDEFFALTRLVLRSELLRRVVSVRSTLPESIHHAQRDELFNLFVIACTLRLGKNDMLLAGLRAFP